MGCDIHMITEIRKDEKWNFIEEIPNSLDTRNYSTFAILADVRNYFNKKGFQPKGLPEDISGMKFRFCFDKESKLSVYETMGRRKLVFSDGCIEEPDFKDCLLHISEEKHKEIDDLRNSDKEYYSQRYYGLAIHYKNNEKDYVVYDAFIVGGHFKEVPYKELYPSFDDFLKDMYEDEWNEEMQDYGYWEIDFECDDFHTPSYLSLQELVDGDYEDYCSTSYKMDRDFYNHFIENGGTFPEIFKIVGDTKPCDIAECFREAFLPTVLISWKDSDENIKNRPIFKGIEELKNIAKKYNITDYNDIRIVFAFDN